MRRIVEHLGVRVQNLVAALPLPWGLRPHLLRLCGIAIGPRTTVLSGSTFASNSLSIGRDCYIGNQCYFDAGAPIVIGDGVSLAFRVTIVTTTHEIGESTMRASTPRQEPVTIGPGCWIGACVTIMPGVTVQQGCVVATGAVLAADCAADGLYAGVPARRVRDLSPAD